MFLSLLGLSGYFALAAYEPEDLVRAFAPKNSKPVERAGFTSLYNPISGLKLSAKKDEFQSDGYSFGLKLKPKGIFEAREYHRMGQSLNAGADQIERGLRSDQLKEAYLLLVRADESREKEVLLAELKRLAEKGAKLSALEAQRSRLDAKGALKAGLELEKIRNEAALTQSSVAEVRALLRRANLKLEDLLAGDILNPEDIYQRLTKAKEVSETLSAKRAKTKFEVEEASLNLKKAQNRRWIEELQLFAKQGKSETRLGFEVTFSLPFMAAGDLDEQKEQLKLEEARLETERALESERIRFAPAAQLLKDKIEVYRSLQVDSSLEDAIGNLRVADANLIIELRRTVLQRKLQRTNLIAEIRSGYVELLYESGEILSDSNVLSKSNRGIF